MNGITGSHWRCIIRFAAAAVTVTVFGWAAGPVGAQTRVDDSAGGPASPSAAGSPAGGLFQSPSFTSFAVEPLATGGVGSGQVSNGGSAGLSFDGLGLGSLGTLVNGASGISSQADLTFDLDELAIESNLTAYGAALGVTPLAPANPLFTALRSPLAVLGGVYGAGATNALAGPFNVARPTLSPGGVRPPVGMFDRSSLESRAGLLPSSMSLSPNFGVSPWSAAGGSRRQIDEALDRMNASTDLWRVELPSASAASVDPDQGRDLGDESGGFRSADAPDGGLSPRANPFESTRGTSLTRPAPPMLSAGTSFEGDNAPGSVFEHMQRSVKWLQGLHKAREDLSDGMESSPSSSDLYSESVDRVRRLRETSIDSFVSGDPEADNSFARRAESLLKSGEYIRAATYFRIAQTAESDNPLYYLGEGHALIGSGEFHTAFRKIARGLGVFPQLGCFSLELTAFYPNPDLLELRRAELEKRLSEREDHQLRFLLGYIEYFSGFPELGRDNLSKAASRAAENSPIRLFWEQLSRGEKAVSQDSESER